MTDHYATLGVAKTASQDEIKKAFRKLASQHHPDKGGDTQKFQEIQAAYDTLGNPEKRAAYDNPAPQFSGFSGGANPFHNAQFNDIFSQMFGGHNPFHQQTQRRGHMRLSLWISLHDVATGGSRPVSLGSSIGASTVEIEIPLGINDGDNVQYQGIGPGGQDLVVQFRVKPDPKWQRDDLNLYCEQKIPLWDMILGGDAEVKTILGDNLVVSIPPRCPPGTTLRLRQQGLKNRNGAQGDILVKLHPEIPQNIAPEILDAIRQYR